MLNHVLRVLNARVNFTYRAQSIKRFENTMHTKKAVVCYQIVYSYLRTGQEKLKLWNLTDRFIEVAESNAARNHRYLNG